MQVNATSLITLPAAATATAPFLRVILTAGVIALAGVGDREVGVVSKRSLVSGVGSSTVASIAAMTPGHVLRMVASGAVTLHARVYAGASGMVSATANGYPIGIAMSATSNSGEELDVLLLREASLGTVGFTITKTADYTVLAADSGACFSTVGAAGTVVFALPPATVGLQYDFYVGAVQELRIDPNGTETISLPSSGVAQAAGAYLTANAVGETVKIKCVVAGTWAVFGFTGTWTAV